MKLWKIIKALADLPDLVALHWAALAIRRHRVTWHCIIDGKPAKLPVLAICPVTDRWLVEFPDGKLEFVSGPLRALRVGESPQPPAQEPSVEPQPQAAGPRSSP